MEEEPMEEEPILQEIEDAKEKLISRISLWVSLLLTTAIVIWYYQANPPDSPEVVRMRVFFKEKNREVMKFINVGRNEQIAFAYKNKHPFYKNYIKASTVEQERIRSLIHISTDFTPNQYWFNLVFMWVIVFTTFWFLGLMTEACIVLARRNSEARIKNYQKEKERERQRNTPSGHEGE
ncbi:MAG: hypothetical protein HOI59_03405 [Nitrospina sp.]|jgi:hypothetical protein|nr:hypothetical protein [Nitrospina sp.]MBT3415778.1 hypothetical protein [Nitrospina sp.]MBT3857983.1 hypothetical protein [Nitrospina sp.]MBT4047241.1 hypothetical protein [Nitrospina sp.]MBT4390425.1 hypothetical protein [Nitrospina sp.]